MTQINIEEILMKDDLFREHFVAKYPPKYKKRYISPKFLKKYPELNSPIKWLNEYVEFPYIEDNFHLIPEGGMTRRELRIEIEKRYGKEARDFIERNKLAKNKSLTGVWATSSWIVDSLNGKYPELKKKAEELVEITLENTERYLDMNLKEKFELARGIEEKVYEMLGEISG